MSIRIRGVDTPEHRLCKPDTHSQSCALCPAEVAAAAKAKSETQHMMDAAKALRVEDVSRGSYWGRVIGDLQVQDAAGRWHSLGTDLLKRNLAEVYDPGKTGDFDKEKGWCPN